MLVPHVLTFPGAFAPHGFLGAGVNTTAWIGIFWRAAPPIAVILLRCAEADGVRQSSLVGTSDPARILQ